MMNVIVLSVTIIGFAGFTANQQISKKIKLDEKKLLVFVKSMASMVSKSVNDKSTDGLEEKIQQLAHFPGVEKIQIIIDNYLLLSIRKKTDGRVITETTAPAVTIPEKSDTEITYQKKLITVWQKFNPETASNASGWVYIEYNTQSHENIAINLYKQSLSVALITTIISLLVLRRLMSKPIRELEKAAEFAEFLDLNQGSRLRLTRSCQETEKLVRALNRTSEKLRLQEESQRNKNLLLDTVSEIQSSFIREKDVSVVFEELLLKLMQLTKSESGFFGEVLLTEDNRPYIQMRNTAGLTTNKQTGDFYDQYDLTRMKFYSMNTLFGAIVQTRKPVIANDASTDPRRGGLPEGHFAVNTFLGLPVFSLDRVVGVIGLANRKEGYEQGIVAYLQPLLAICGHMVEGYRNDISRKETQNELKRKNSSLKAILSRVSDGVISLSSGGEIVSANTAAAKMFGYYEDELNGINITRLIPEIFVNFKNNVRLHTTELMQVTGKNKEGNPVALELGIAEYHHGDEDLYVMTIRDVSNNNVTMSTETNVFNYDGRDMLNRLTAVRGSLALLMGNSIRHMPASDRSFVDKMNENLQYLINHVDRISNINRFKSSRSDMAMQAVNIDTLVEHVLDNNQDLCRKNSISFKYYPDATCLIDADELYFQQAIRYLLEKITDKAKAGSTVEVSSFVEAGVVRLQISSQTVDTDVDAREISRYFSDDADLHLCQLIIEKHDGMVRCFSHQNGGLEFFIAIPVLKQQDSTVHG